MLEVKAIDLHYGAAQALRNVSLHAQVGEVTCVLGRNGVGKTSLLDALAGQQPISSGADHRNREEQAGAGHDDRYRELHRRTPRASTRIRHVA